MNEESEFSDDPSPSSSQPRAPEGRPEESESRTDDRASSSAGSDPFKQNPFGRDAADQSFADANRQHEPSGQAQLRMAWDVTRMWVKDHQTAAMLGAFATGVFVGAYLRD